MPGNHKHLGFPRPGEVNPKLREPFQRVSPEVPSTSSAFINPKCSNVEQGETLSTQGGRSQTNNSFMNNKQHLKVQVQILVNWHDMLVGYSLY